MKVPEDQLSRILSSLSQKSTYLQLRRRAMWCNQLATVVPPDLLT